MSTFPRPTGFVTLASDFGLDGPYVAMLHGALLRTSTKVRVIDLGHAVPPHDIAAGSFLLWTAIGRFPSGTVHVGVVDPGAFTERRLLAIAAHGDYWLLPDNGLAGAILAGDERAEVRELDIAHLGIQLQSSTFHGRDVLAPVGALLASGRYGFSAMGPRVGDARRDDLVFAGGDRIVNVDRLGNLVSNVRRERAETASAVRLADREVALRRTYQDVPAGELLAYVGSFGLLEVAANGGSAAALLGLQCGAAISLGKP